MINSGDVRSRSNFSHGFVMTIARIAILAVFCGLTARLIAADAPDIKVMSYNVRYGTAKDGDNHWDKRKDFMAEVINTFDPDLLGTQETLGFQRDFLAEKMPKFE